MRGKEGEERSVSVTISLPVSMTWDIENERRVLRKSFSGTISHLLEKAILQKAKEREDALNAQIRG